jgi:ketosteroid isomerase-like protein
MDDLARLVAIEEIRRLAHAYALAIDSRDIDALVDLFVDDVQVGRDRRGRDALREDFTRQLREVGVTILFVGNHLIDFDDEQSARGIVYCKAEVQLGDRWVHQAIQYRDTYARRDARWRFVRRRHLLWYGSDVGANPLGLPPARWPEHQTGLGTLPESWETWQRFWKESGST